MGGIPIVSLDSIYLLPDNDSIYFLDCTRLDKSKDLVSRKNPNDKTSVDKDIDRISKELLSKGLDSVILADDVVFSGSVLRSIIDKFNADGIKVLGVRCSVSSKEGYDYFNNNLLLGLKCGCLMSSEVIDQICERDFYFGIAQSGISVRYGDLVYKAPYFKPFGNPVERASIPEEYEELFSKGCLVRSLALWKCISELSGKKILVSDMPEVILNTNSDDEVVPMLEKEYCKKKVLRRNMEER